MKNLTMIFLVFFLFTSFKSDELIDRIGVKGPINYGNKSYHLAWSVHPSEHYYVQEYLPPEETLEHFNEMMTINVLDAELTAARAVEIKIGDLEERKKEDKLIQYQVQDDPTGKEFILDFVVGETKRNRQTIVEFNVYRFKQIQTLNGRRALLVFFYSHRSYGNAIVPFLRDLGKERTDYINQMISAVVPEIRIAER